MDKFSKIDPKNHLKIFQCQKNWNQNFSQKLFFKFFPLTRYARKLIILKLSSLRYRFASLRDGEKYAIASFPKKGILFSVASIRRLQQSARCWKYTWKRFPTCYKL